MLSSGLVSNSKKANIPNFGNAGAVTSLLGNGAGPSKTQQQATLLGGLGGKPSGTLGLQGLGAGLGVLGQVNGSLNGTSGQSLQPTRESEFNIDLQEYSYVFKVFDKNESGEINISQVQELINKFD